MDKETRLAKLAELRASREAKQRESSNIAAQAPSPSSIGTVTLSEPYPPRNDATTDSPARPAFTSVENNVGVVSILPEEPIAVMKYDHCVETEHVYVYDEPRQHPSEVVSNADVELILQERLTKREAKGEDLTGSFNGTAVMMTTTRTSLVPGPRPLWDKSATASSLKFCLTPAFISFFSKGAASTADVLRQGTISSDMIGKALSARHESAADTEGLSVKLTRRGRFYDAATSHDAIVTALAFQPHTSDVFAAAMVSGAAPPMDGTEASALTTVLLWFSRKVGPPMRFTSDGTGQARALTWSRFHEHLLIAGTDCGRIILWNTCSHGNGAVVTSFPGPDSHHHAILRLAVQGDDNANALVSVGSDGKVCTWPVDRPRRPTNVRDSNQDPATAGVFASAAALYDSVQDDGTFSMGTRALFGTHDGAAISAMAKNARVLDCRQLSEEVRHDAMITSIDAHPSHSDRRISELVLTTSLDRSCRVWHGGHALVQEGFPDDVYDAKWSPTAPSVFACVDGSGTLYIFNLSTSTSKPCARLNLRQVSASTGSDGQSGSSGAPSSSKAMSVVALQWDDSGHCIVCGTSMGEVFLVDVSMPVLASDVATRQLNEWVAALTSAAV